MKVFITGSKGYDNTNKIKKLLEDVSQVIAGPSEGAEDIACSVAEKEGVTVNYDFFAASSYVDRIAKTVDHLKATGGKVICIEPGAKVSDKLHVLEVCKEKGVPYLLIN